MEQLVEYEKPLPREIIEWRNEILEGHQELADELVKDYKKRAGKKNKNNEHFWVDSLAIANRELRKLDKKLKAPFISVLAARIEQVNVDIDNDEIKFLADRAARHFSILKNKTAGKNLAILEAEIDAGLADIQIKAPFKIRDKDNGETRREKTLKNIARLSDSLWWRRKIRQKFGRQSEKVLRELGAVVKQKSPYISEPAFKRWRYAQKRNRDLLERLEAVNELGESCSLAEASDKSPSNPVNRRNEFMVRSRGFEEIAKTAGLDCQFLTLTAPSKYHVYLASGMRNVKFKGATPLDTMKYLNNVWAKIRAEWHTAGIKAFGFRIAEPHHDGTPHLHFLLYTSKGDTAEAWKIFKRLALAEDGKEKGAKKHRATRVLIDSAKGSATGYIAKYIAKNIDGYKVGLDEEGDCLAEVGALRAKAWASLWGIRQFQQIGSISVTVWRELRRLKSKLVNNDEIEEIRKAADRGDWQEFVELMGGATVSRSDQTLRILYAEGGKLKSRYNEELKRIFGVILRGSMRFAKTREHVWQIREGVMRKQKSRDYFKKLRERSDQQNAAQAA